LKRAGTELKYDRNFLLFLKLGLVLLLFLLSWNTLKLNIVRLGFAPGMMHRIHLVFHEAGHIVFYIFGPLVAAMGGTILQLLMPILVSASLLIKNRDYFGALAGVWWLGHSMADCAPYINDARVLQLPLLGGGTGAEREGHDWEFILGRLDILSQDIYIARAFLVIGRLLIVMSLVVAVAVALRAFIRAGRETRANYETPADADA